MLLHLRSWIYAARPKTLCIGLMPILLGSFLAMKLSLLHMPTLFLCILGALTIQIGTNYCNDYFDYINCADTSCRQGNKKVIEQGLISADAMKKAFIASFLLAAIVACFLVQRGGFSILIIACICILFSIAYTAPPFPLAYLGLGDVFVLIFYGPIATMTCFYLHTHQLDWHHLIVGCMPGVLGLGPLIMNNLRDVDQDRAANKKTLIVRLGESFGQRYFLCTVALGICLPYIQSIIFDKNPFVICTSFAFIPLLKNLPLLFSVRDKHKMHQLFIVSAKTVPLFTLCYALSELLFYVSKAFFT